jgi:hypothetical protein
MEDDYFEFIEDIAMWESDACFAEFLYIIEGTLFLKLSELITQFSVEQ